MSERANVNTKNGDPKTSMFDLSEAGAYGGPDAPWAPVPIQNIKRWLKKTPEAQLESVFPTVYEEDRTAKIKDLATAQGLKYITHQRAAEQAVKELGFENYDYEEEQAAIAEEAETLGPSLGVGDDLAGTSAQALGVGGPVARTGIRPSTIGTDGQGDALPDGTPRAKLPNQVAGELVNGNDDVQASQLVKRKDVSGDEEHAFRRAQKESVDAMAQLVREVTTLVTKVRESLASHNSDELERTLKLMQERLLQPLPEIPAIPAPIINVTLPEPKPRTIAIRRDKAGNMVAMEESTKPTSKKEGV